MTWYKVALAVRVGSSVIVDASDVKAAIGLAQREWGNKLEEVGCAVDPAHFQIGSIEETQEAFGIRKT